MLCFFLLLCLFLPPKTVAGVSVQDKRIWIYVSDSKQKPLANVHIGIVEWTITATTDMNGRARLLVPPKAQLGDPMTIVILSHNFATFNQRPFRTRISSFDRADQPIEITVQRGQSLIRSAAVSIRKGERGVISTLPSNDPYIAGRRSLADAHFQDALENLTKAYNTQQSLYESLHTSSSRVRFSQVCYYLGLTLFKLARFDEAKSKFEQASRLQTQWFEPHYFLAECSNIQGDYVNAEEEYKQAIALPSAPSNPLTRLAHMGLADIYQMYGKLDEFNKQVRLVLAPIKGKARNLKLSAILHLDDLISRYLLDHIDDTKRSFSTYETLAVMINDKAKLIFWEKELGRTHPFLLIFLNSLADEYIRLNEYESASKCYERALDICKRTFGEVSLKVAAVLMSMADFDEEQERYDQAKEKYRKALQIAQTLFGPQSPRVAEIHYSLGNLFEKEHNYAQAEEQYQIAVDIVKKTYGTKHPMYIFILTELADLMSDQDKYKEAALLLEQALQSAKALWGTPGSIGFEDISDIMDHLIDLYEKQGKSDQAHQLSEQKETLEKLPRNPNSRARTWHSAPISGLNLRGGSFSYMQPSDPDEDTKCEPLLRQALNVSDQIIRKADHDVLALLQALSHLYYYTGSYEQARIVIQRFLDSSQNALDSNPLRTANALNLRGLVSHSLEHYTEAEKDYRTALAIFELQVGKNSQDVVPVLYNLGMILKDERKYEESQSILKRALAIRERKDDEIFNANPDSITILWGIAKILCETNEYNEAEARYKQIFTVISPNHLKNYSSSVPILEDYARCLRLMNRPGEAVPLENMAKAIKNSKAKSAPQ